MPSALQTTSYAPTSIHDDLEGLASVPEKKPLLLSAFSSCLNLVRRYPFLSSILIIAILVGIVASIVNFSYRRDFRFPDWKIPPNESGIVLLGLGHRLDTDNLTLSIQWEILGCGAYTRATYLPGDNTSQTLCGILDRAVDVYFNAAPEPTYSYDPTGFPSTLTNETQYVYRLTAFGVDHVIDGYSTPFTPFDDYFIALSAFVIEKATNRSLPILTFATGRTQDNFIISSIEIKTKNNYTYDSGTGPTTVEVRSSLIHIEAKRAQVAQAFTMCLLLVNYALTIGSIYITLLVVFTTEEINDAVLLLPVTIILTIPTLRGLYPGSPPFGVIIDTVGLFLQMMIVAVCSMVLVYVVITKSAAAKRRASSDNGNTRLLG